MILSVLYFCALLFAIEQKSNFVIKAMLVVGILMNILGQYQVYPSISQPIIEELTMSSHLG